MEDTENSEFSLEKRKLSRHSKPNQLEDPEGSNYYDQSKTNFKQSQDPYPQTT